MEVNPLHPMAIPLHGSVTHHKWGTKGVDSAAARMQMHNKFCSIDPDKPYSEFVISTHPQHKQAVLLTTPSVTLRDHAQTQVIEVDSSMVEFYSRLHAEGIPYILKVTSVSEPQSLHVHPDTAKVREIAESNPEAYDRHAKAVMIVAQGNVDMLFGFQSAQSIVGELSRVPEFADAVGRPETDQFVHIVKTSAVKPSHIRNIVTSLLSRKRDFIHQCMQAAAERLLKMPDDAVTSSDRKFISLRKRYPEDPMCFSVYLLNRLEMEAGNAIFVHPQEPYCVLSGEFIEASSFSETSIHGGLVDDPVDNESFLNSLSYDDSPVEVSTGERFSDFGVSYVPPVSQFQLLEFKLPKDVSQQMVETIAPSVVMVLDGEGTIKVDGRGPVLPLRPGSVYYLNPQTPFLVTALRTDSLLHFIQIGVNESAAPSTSTSCSVM